MSEQAEEKIVKVYVRRDENDDERSLSFESPRELPLEFWLDIADEPGNACVFPFAIDGRSIIAHVHPLPEAPNNIGGVSDPMSLSEVLHAQQVGLRAILKEHGYTVKFV